jgi:DNA-binding protein Fis
LAVLRRQASVQGAELDDTDSSDSQVLSRCVALFDTRSRENRNSERLGIIKDAVAALERASVVLRAEALIKEWDSLDIKSGINLYQEVRRFETWLIKRALQETDGNQSRAARLLGLNTSTLHEKMKRYGIN